jgi:hypothetical protein
MLSYGETINVPVDSLYVASRRKASTRDEKAKKFMAGDSKVAAKIGSKYQGIDPREASGLIYRDADGNYKEYKRKAAKVKTPQPPAKIGTIVKPVKPEELEETTCAERS